MNCLILKTVVLIVLHYAKCVYSGSLRSNLDMANLKHNLDANEYSVSLLAESICYDLEHYHIINNKTTPFSVEDCQNNFMKITEKRDEIPPEAVMRSKDQSAIVYDITPVQDPDVMRLIVLTPINRTATYLPYDLLENNSKKLSSVDISSGKYRTWITLVSRIDGSHSNWRVGQIVPANSKTCTIKVDTEHQVVNGRSAVKATIRWESLDAEDGRFELGNICNNKSAEWFIVWPNNTTSLEVNDLPMDEDCEVLLIGKYTTTMLSYRTPDCKDLPDCVYYEKAHNLSLMAELGAHGWDVFVSWTYLHQPLAFNVTFISEHEKRNMLVPGNVTEAVFLDVEDFGFYTVAVAAELETRSAYTHSRAQFPVEAAGWREVGPALGGAWGALACAGVAGAAAALLWRKRRSNQLKHIYFQQEPSDKPCKHAGEAEETEATTTEDAWELRSEKLLLHEVIGEGAFGVVRRGTLSPGGKEVAVKMLKDFPTLDEIRSFRAEIELMKSVGAHPHVVSLVGCCSGRKPFIVAEYCSRGDLLSYLRCSWDVMVSKRNAKYYNNNIESTDYRNDLFKCQLQGEHSKLVVNKLYDLGDICDTELTTRDLLSFCRQIAMGMEFLAANRLVHRDLAARNVLVSSDRTLKIADFGLSRDVYEENLYKQKGNGKMPMKWMALESLTKRIYTSQSDVWSFGVVMWEVVSVGAAPYAGVPPARLPRLLRAGYRMPRPINCSKQLYEVMVSCWHSNPRSRPTFTQLHARLDELLNTACQHHYLSLQPDNDEPPPHQPHKYVAMYLKSKLGWSREDSYERPLRSATQSNHYSTPPASPYKLQPV